MAIPCFGNANENNKMKIASKFATNQIEDGSDMNSEESHISHKSQDSNTSPKESLDDNSESSGSISVSDNNEENSIDCSSDYSSSD